MGLAAATVALLTEIICSTLNHHVIQRLTKSRVLSSVATYPHVHNNSSQLINSSLIWNAQG